MGSPPLVSVVIIFLNERQFLEEAIQSVFEQSYQYWELLLVDDGSSDGSTEIARRFADTCSSRVRYLEHSNHANRGMSASRNLGWTQARGSLVAFLDGDDIWLPTKLEHQVQVLQAHFVDVVYGNTELWYGWTGDPQDVARDCLRGVGIGANAVVAPPELMLRCFPLGPAPSPATCSILMRRTVLETVGGFEEGFRGMFEDQAFLAKLYLHASIFVSEECHDRYRMRPDSCVSRSTRAGHNDEATHRFLKWLATYLQKERVREPTIWHAVRSALRPYRYPYVYALSRQFRHLSEVGHFVVSRAYNHVTRLRRHQSTGMITAVPNPILASDRFGVGATTLSWRARGVSKIEIRVNSPDGPLFGAADATGQAHTGLSVVDGTLFYLQDATHDVARTSRDTLDVVRVRVQSVITPGALAPQELPPDVARWDRSTASSKSTALPASFSAEGRIHRYGGCAVILLYHRVAEISSDPWTLAVSPDRFVEHLEVLRKVGRILSLAELCVGADEGALYDRSVAITFDDGYADCLHVVKPLLDRLEIPATFFVTTGALTDPRHFWWDDVDRLFLQTASLPRTLEFSISGKDYEWDLGEDAEYPEEVQQLHRHWRAWGQADPTRRQVLYREIYHVLYPLGSVERRTAMDELLEWGGLSLNDARGQTLTAQELVTLADGCRIDIGAHTVTHSRLGSASSAVQRQEITESKQELERILTRPVTTFAYPFGKIGDYTNETVDLVRASGFRSACSNFPGLVRPAADRYQLPRMFMGNWSGAEFEARLATWFGAVKD